ncbi:MAG: hypothetical protein AAF558_14295 [Verrucomicrobiota bacterium]
MKTPNRPRLYLYGGALAAGILLILLVSFITYDRRDDHAEMIIEYLSKEAGLEMDVQQVELDPGGSLVLKNLQLGDLGHISSVELQWTWRGVIDRRIKRLRVHGVELRLSELTKLGKERGEQSTRELQPFLLEELILGQGVLLLDDLGPGIPPVPLRVGQATPLVFKDLQLGGKVSDPAAKEIQVAYLDDLKIYSPYDPLVEVLEFDRVRVAFSWAGIQSKQLDRLDFIRPVIFVGEELFWLVDQVESLKKEEIKLEKEKRPWTIANFGVEGGRVIVTTFGRPGFTLPFSFRAETTGMVLSNFSQTPLQTNLEIPTTNLSYPEYGVRVSNMRGDLQFSLPPGEEDVDNIVNTVKMDSISWKGVTVTEAWVSITFDEKGIYGRLGGESYDGYTEGNFSILVQEGMKWNADASISNTEVRAIAEKLIPEYLTVNGPISGEIVLEGKQREILKVSGNVGWEEPGSLEIVAVDDILNRIPEGWELTKKDMASIALNAFREYDYYKGTCEFEYKPPQSFVNLEFDGEQGERNFSIGWNDLRDEPGFSW